MPKELVTEADVRAVLAGQSKYLATSSGAVLMMHRQSGKLVLRLASNKEYTQLNVASGGKGRPQADP